MDDLTLPAPLDVIVINDTIDQRLQDIVEQSGGDIFTANLRTVEARVNEIRTQWGQPTYALHAPWPAGWEQNAELSLLVTLSSGTQEAITVGLRDDYTLPLPPTPTTEPSPVLLATLPDDETPEATEAVALADATPGDGAAAPDAPQAPNDGIALLLMVGAGLFMVGAVVVALALSRVQRAPIRNQAHQTSASFYDALEQADDESVTATKIGERGILGDPDTHITRVAPAPDPAEEEDEFANEDDLIITQVLTDERFQKMMERSEVEEEVVGWVRLEGIAQGDYELRRRGLIVGRGQDCDIQVKGDPSISRQHARLDVQEDGQVTVSRLSAVNPVIVGGKQVSNRHPLKPNDVIHLSDEARLVFIARETDDAQAVSEDTTPQPAPENPDDDPSES